MSRKKIVAGILLGLSTVTAQAALVQLDANFHNMNPNRCNSYVYDCPTSLQLTMVFDTTAYGSSSMRFKETENEWNTRLDMGRLEHWRFLGLPINSLVLRADDRILLDDPTGLTFGSAGTNLTTKNTGTCLCDLSIAGGGIQFRINYDTPAGNWPNAAELGGDPLAFLLSGVGNSGTSVFNDFAGPWGSLEGQGVVSFSVVPIPAAAWLFGSALGVMGWMRRKVSS
jgi:hypothetical protein